MLEELLRFTTPDMLMHAIKSNPLAVLSTLQKFDVFVSFGQGLTSEQQICISNNLNKLNDFFKSSSGRNALGSLANEFMEFTKK